MSDEELIARLREDVFYGDERLHNLSRHNPLHMGAADRIEALTKELDREKAYAFQCAMHLDAALEQLNAVEAKLSKTEGLLAENEVRLRKAVKALEEISEYDTGATAGLAYTAKHHLAVIKSGIATTPYGLEGEGHE